MARRFNKIVTLLVLGILSLSGTIGMKFPSSKNISFVDYPQNGSNRFSLLSNVSSKLEHLRYDGSFSSNAKVTTSEAPTGSPIGLDPFHPELANKNGIQGFGGSGGGLGQLSVDSSFSGVSLDQEINDYGIYHWPPDTIIAVSPNYVVEMVNSTMYVFSLTGSVLGSYNSATFFGSVSGWYLSDPQIRYDSVDSRWVATAMSYAYNTGGQVFIDVSQTANPLGAWNKYTILSNTGGTIYDQPMTAIYSDKVIVSVNDYASNFNASSFTGQQTYVIQLSDLLSGVSSPRMVSLFGSPDTSRFRLVPVTEEVPSTTAYLVYNDSNTKLGVIKVTGTPGGSNVQYSETDLTVNSFNYPPPADQPTLLGSIDTNDNRYVTAVSENGEIWIGADDGCYPSGDSSLRPCARLQEVSISGSTPALIQDFDYGINGEDVYFPTISIDSSNNVFIGFTLSSSTIYPSSDATVIPQGGGGGSALPVTTISQGQALYNNDQGVCGGSSLPSRWGDYGGSQLDPSNPSIVWVASEFSASSTLSETDNCDWGTSIASVSFNSSTPSVPYNPITPYRVCDTRVGSNSPTNQCTGKTLNASSTLSVKVSGYGGIPSSGVSAVVANVTVTNTTANSYLSVWPQGGVQPNVSSLNWNSGTTVPNLITVGVSSTGSIEIYNYQGSVDVIVDLEGWYGSSSNAGLYTPLSPGRICDTRAPSYYVVANQCDKSGHSPLGPDSSITINVGGLNGVPNSGVSSVVLNVTAVNPTASSGGYLTVWPSNVTSRPLASNLNFLGGETIANRVIVPVDPTTGQINIYNYLGQTDVLVDLEGWYSTSTSSGLYYFTPSSPIRLCDTRPAGSNVQPNQCDSSGNGPIGQNSVLTVQIAGVDGIPTTATGVVMNITVVSPTTSGGGYITVYPSDVLMPIASDINFSNGETLPNMTVEGLATSGVKGSIDVYNYNGQTNIIVDVVGWF